MKQEAVKKTAEMAQTISSEFIERNGVIVDKEQNAILTDIITSQLAVLLEGSPQWLLWQQQCQQAKDAEQADHNIFELYYLILLILYIVLMLGECLLNDKKHLLTDIKLPF